MFSFWTKLFCKHDWKVIVSNTKVLGIKKIQLKENLLCNKCRDISYKVSIDDK
jgi:ATP sulfurylase